LRGCRARAIRHQQRLEGGLVIIGGAVWLTQIIVAVVSRRPILWTVAKVIDISDGERRQWTDGELRNAKGL
jgi:hypothetical protein